MKCIRALTLVFITLLLSSCTANFDVENFTGVWQTRDFEKNTMASFPDPYVSVYVTKDGNLYILLTTDTTAGHMTDTLHYRYEITDGQLNITPLNNPGRYDMESVQISAVGSNIRLDLRGITSWIRPSDFLFTLYKVSDELPYGWTDADRQEISDTLERIRKETAAFAERFSGALNISFTPRTDITWMRGLAFAIGDNIVSIEFVGQTPSPIRAQRHTPVPNPSFQEQVWLSETSANAQFILFHDDWGGEFITEELLEIFHSVDDLFDWGADFAASASYTAVQEEDITAQADPLDLNPIDRFFAEIENEVYFHETTNGMAIQGHVIATAWKAEMENFLEITLSKTNHELVKEILQNEMHHYVEYVHNRAEIWAMIDASSAFGGSTDDLGWGSLARITRSHVIARGYREKALDLFDRLHWINSPQQFDGKSYDFSYFVFDAENFLKWMKEEYPLLFREEGQGKPETFTTTKRLHEDMPEYTFIRTLGDFVDFPDFMEEERYVSITILDENGNIIQEIKDIVQGGHGYWMVPQHEIFDIRFEDFNFDGYMDMWLITAANPGTAGGEWGYHWLWHPESGQFVLNEQLNFIGGGMTWLSVDYETQQIITSQRAGPGHFVRDFYEYHDGDFIHVLSIETIPAWHRVDGDYDLEIITTNRITGEITVERITE